jgi:hypothetical protein
MITINSQLDMTPGAIPAVIHRSQYDSDFSIVFTLFARTGNFTIASGTTAKIRGTKKSGTGYSADATLDVSAKTVTVTGDQQMTVTSGQNIFEIVLMSGTKELCSANFILNVERAALDMDTITDDTVARELDNLDQFVTDAEAAADRAENASVSLRAIKTALLNCFQHVAWTDEHGQDYYDALEVAFDSKELASITAVFTQGSATIYPDTPLDDLKQYLVVTANYTDSTSAPVTNYTLRGTLSAGTSTITVVYGGKTATFDVVVTGGQTNLLYNWNFKNSLVDSVSGKTAVTTATRDTNGLTFTEPNKYLDLGTVYSRNRTYEIDVSYIGEQYPSSSLAYRRIFAFGENGENTSSNTAALTLPKKFSYTEWVWYLGSGWDDGGMETSGDYSVFDGKTLKIYIDTSGYAHVSSKTVGASDSSYVAFGKSAKALNDYSKSNAHVYIGGTSDALGNAVITGFRIYEGEK